MHPFEILLVSSWVYPVFQFFRRLGPFGLLLLSMLDSSFLFLPLGNDLLLVALITASRGSPIWILDLAMCSAGSMLGVLILDVSMRKAGEKGLKRFLSRRRLERIKSKLEKRAGWALFAAALSPPPFPFTAVVMSAAALQYSRRKLLVAVFTGRLLRFTLVALLALYFGNRLVAYANSPGLEYFVYTLVAVGLIGSTLSIAKWVRGVKK